MRRNAWTASVIALLLAVAGPAMAQVRWVDKDGKTHVTDKMPKQDLVTAEEWSRLQTEEEKKKQADVPETETLPVLQAGLILKWKGKDGAEHHGNEPPRRSQVTDAEWERLKAEIPKLNEAAAKSAEAKPPEPAKADAPPADAGGDKLPDLPAGKSLLWNGKDGKDHMTSTPPAQGDVTAKEWARLKTVIADMIEDAKNAPPAPAAEPTPEAKPAPATPGAEDKKPESTKSMTTPEGGTSSLGSSSPDGVLEVACEGDLASPGKYDVSGNVKNISSDRVARNVKIVVDVMSDRKPVKMASVKPVVVPAVYPGSAIDFGISFEIPANYPRTSLTCSARIVGSDVQAQ